MFEFVWDFLKLTGNVDIYLLFKELEKDEKHC
jgi:YqzL-like protein